MSEARDGDPRIDERAERFRKWKPERYEAQSREWQLDQANWIAQWGDNPDGTKCACINLDYKICRYLARLYGALFSRSQNAELKQVFGSAQANALFYSYVRPMQSPKQQNPLSGQEEKSEERSS